MKFDLGSLRPAVLVIDMQASFIAADGPFRNTGMAPVVATLNAFLAACRRHGLRIMFCNYMMRADGTDAGLLRDQPYLEHMLECSPTIGTDPRVSRHPSDHEMHHHRPSAFFNTELAAWLLRQDCNALILTGVSVNNAISATARDAFARDLPAIVVCDCVAAAPFEPPELAAAYLQILDSWTAEVTDSADVLRRFGIDRESQAE